MMAVTVVVVGDTESRLVAGLATYDRAVQVVRQCPALDELLAACQSGLAQVAVVAEFARDLNATLIDRLRAVGVSVVAVAASEAEFTRLKEIGAYPVNITISAETLAEMIRSAADGHRHPGSAGYAVPDLPDDFPLMNDAELSPPPPSGTFARGASADGSEAAQDPSVSAVQKHAGMDTEIRRSAGTLVAVWGPIGSPGRTTLAINLAAEQALAGHSVILIDADSYGASMAAFLGLLEESASFAQACRAADQGSLTPSRLAQTATRLVFKGGTLSLLTGLTRADRWPELRAAAVERVLKIAKDTADLVIVDCGFGLEDDEELSYDTVAPRRNAATLKTLAHADLVFAVGSGDPVGIPRLIRGLDELGQHCPAAEVRVVINKVRRKAVGGSPEKSLAQAWERFGPMRSISHFLPWDHDVTDQALLEGRLLLELSPDAPLRRAIRDMNCAVGQQLP